MYFSLIVLDTNMLLSTILVDQSIPLKNRDSVSAAEWRALSVEERDEYRNLADQEPPRSIDLKQKIDQLFDLVMK